MIYSGCQLNLAKRNAIPIFYWEMTLDMGLDIEETPVQLLGKVDRACKYFRFV